MRWMPNVEEELEHSCESPTISRRVPAGPRCDAPTPAWAVGGHADVPTYVSQLPVWPLLSAFQSVLLMQIVT